MTREPDGQEPGRWRRAAEHTGLVDIRPRRPMTVRRFLRSFLVLLPIMSGAVILCELLDWPSALGYGFGAGIGAGIADAVDRRRS